MIGKKLVIGVPTYNRRLIVEKMARSLYMSDITVDCSIRVYDDSSFEYNENDLREMFPTAQMIHRNSLNVGADSNTWQMYLDFYESGENYFLNADSDLIFSSRWMAEALRLIERTDGILSIFNTRTREGSDYDDELCIKDVLGAAGTIMSREIVGLLIEGRISDPDFQPEKTIDYGFSQYLKKQNIRLFNTKKSYVQHIGFTGYNSRADRFDYGSGFEVDTIFNGQVINDMVEMIVADQVNYGIKTYYYLFPFEIVPKGSKIVLYGVGKIGNDFLKQIKSTDYYQLVAVVDKKSDGKEVLPVEAICNFEYDYIVLGTTSEENCKSMIGTIMTIAPDRIDRVRFSTDDRRIRI